MSSVHPQSENAEVHLKSVIQSVSLPAASNRHQALNTIFDPSSKFKIVNEFFARSDVKQEMYQIRIICLFVVTEGSNSNQSNTTPLTKL